jgi:hypothetical protein
MPAGLRQGHEGYAGLRPGLQHEGCAVIFRVGDVEKSGPA